MDRIHADRRASGVHGVPTHSGHERSRMVKTRTKRLPGFR